MLADLLIGLAELLRAPAIHGSSRVGGMSEVLVKLVLRDVIQAVLISYVHAGSELFEELSDALLHVATYAIIYLLPCSLDDEVNKVWVGGDLSLLASVRGVLITFDSHQWFSIAVGQVP